MYRRTAAALATAVTAGALALGTAATAEAAPGPGWYARSHHASYADCQAAGVAGYRIWGPIFFCEPLSSTRPDVTVLWVRY
ncbi:hypothetical protein AQF52_5569 [Streptomyces venezuelae]|uniref:hypothetical protein n=1 Tax=Streptomyces gardneri TaxID=66892 RepID=UPI0006BD69D0|nr:hypothetical protein [Streptomyces gardneri]ALO11163.1 hypothetical protein AQF52_5569 [Streptomyces venezuelae]QPK48095.1 hypothetical protein H4W23_27950 [Streptomyces gardneri]WRK39552.1 hypothetical protein U0M97_28075 [Streptomyces venezuelae]CUM38328.1 hypothetical protein BN2537_5621 [Streptomyces venezuelae]